MSDNKELRDRLAALCGWTYTEVQGRPFRWSIDVKWTKGIEVVSHPFPDGDLTALAAVWPEGWWCSVNYMPVERGSHGMPWYANGGIAESEWEYGADTEYDARLRLTVAVLEAMA